MKELRLKLFDIRKELKKKMVTSCLNIIFAAGRNEAGKHKKILFDPPYIMSRTGTQVVGMKANGNSYVNLLLLERNEFGVLTPKTADLGRYALSYDDVDMLSYFLDEKMYKLE